MKKHISCNAVALLLVSIMLISTLAFLPTNTAYAQGSNMTFTTGETIQFGSTVEMSFWSGISMKFGTKIQIQFVDADSDGILEPCDLLLILQPPGYIPPVCSWWEILNPMGHPTGFEFHVDWSEPQYSHVDFVIPGPFPIPPQMPFLAQKKIEEVKPCDYFVVHEPQEFHPMPCSWWEIMNPETREPTGFEFHVDWTNESCEFHVDEVIPHSYMTYPFYELEARQKIEQIEPCDWFTVLDPAGFVPTPCSWWEILDPNTGTPTGLEFHVDQVLGGTFHVDQVLPPQSPIQIPWGPTYTVNVRKKVDVIQQCDWFKVKDLSNIPQPCTWWKITYPTNIGDVEFHVDTSNPDGTFHVDIATSTTFNPPVYELTAMKKIDDISPCDWFVVIDPPGWLPQPCTWWNITKPTQWAGVTFHVDSNDQISRFHIDAIDPLPSGPVPPPWNVTAEPFTPPDPWYFKPEFRDYAPSGMPDFDQRQGGTYPWIDNFGAWSHCGPVAVANSLWWLDSEYEPNPVLPPTINDGFPLVRAYGPWDDHDPQNLPPLVEHLAWLMDCDGRRTGLIHSGTNVFDMEAGLTHYLSWTGVNPFGDVNGDGVTNLADLTIINAAFGSVPGAPSWNLAADIFPASITYPPVTDNVVDMNDVNLYMANYGRTGVFYEHTVVAPDFYYIEGEVEKCQDVVLLIGYWTFTGSQWYREEGGHFVTVAGVNSRDVKLAISDPIRDAFETGLTPEGRIPIPHVHMPPEPPYTTHNNAAFVSQDIYNVTLLPPMPPCPGGNWALVNFPGIPGQGMFAVLEYAVITSPLGIHDVAVTNITTCKDGCIPMRTVCRRYTAHVNVTVLNDGNFTESFTVTAYANTTVIGTQNVVSLPPATQTVLTFVWNTSGYAIGKYTLSAQASTVPGETDTGDNTYVDAWVKVTIVGDINGDDKVNMLDVGPAARGFMTTPGIPFWNPNADIDDSHKIDMIDIGTISRNFGATYP